MSESSPAQRYVAAMQLALDAAASSALDGEVPVGAVVMRGAEIIACRHNERESSHDPTAHAEVLALRDAGLRLGRWRLDDCTLVVTLEPCIMCAGAAVNSRICELVYGAADLKAGAVGSLYNVCADPRLNHNPVVRAGLLRESSERLLRAFFEERRVNYFE